MSGKTGTDKVLVDRVELARLQESDIRKQETDARWSAMHVLVQGLCRTIGVPEFAATPSFNSVEILKHAASVIAKRDGLREALKFYAKEKNWTMVPVGMTMRTYIEHDRGARAQVALGGTEKPETEPQ